MSEPGAGSPGTEGNEDVGSVAEEAAKLFGALQDWAADTGAGQADASAAAAAAMAAGLRGVNEHLATGGQDCTWCPVCQVVHRVRETSPEIRAHLSDAASSLLKAAAGLLETHVPTPPTRGGVQHIDLDAEDETPDSTTS